MTNESSPRIDATRVQRLVAEQFPPRSDLPVRPVERSGWDNRSFRLGDDPLGRSVSCSDELAMDGPGPARIAFGSSNGRPGALCGRAPAQRSSHGARSSERI